MSDDSTRLDKWLWAARFYKTRSAATEAVAGGKVVVNDESVKPSRTVHLGDTVRVRQPPYEFVVVVTGIGERRGSATVAATLYQETEASRETRERAREQLRLAPNLEFSEGKPSKRDRRDLQRIRGRK